MSPKIRTTHVGSLPRPAPLVPFLRARHQNQPVDAAAFADATRRAVLDCVAEQVACGVDIVSDGEMAKMSYAYYVQDRLAGLESADAAAQRGVTLRRFQTMGVLYPAIPRLFGGAGERAGRTGFGQAAGLHWGFVLSRCAAGEQRSGALERGSR